mmetsp:Transcript_90741/g.242950  ORF Transcript_90741/g.242950 Transcript_90741/m.242950 type:complete len:425 (-) Transcript_90741:413-1687(-)
MSGPRRRPLRATSAARRRPLVPRAEPRSSEEAEAQCCVCYSKTGEVTPCGHSLCRGCHVALKSRDCPMCRRGLPAPAAIDYDALLASAMAGTTGDLVSLLREVAPAGACAPGEASRVRGLVAEALVQRVRRASLLELGVGPLAGVTGEPLVHAAVSERLEALSSSVTTLTEVTAFISQAEPVRASDKVLAMVVDNMVGGAVQRVVTGLTLGEIKTSASTLATLRRHPAIDPTIFGLTLGEAMTAGLAEEFSPHSARAFVRAAEAVATHKLLSPEMGAYVARLFAAQASAYVSVAPVDDLNILVEVLGGLPQAAPWGEIRENIMNSVARRAGVLVRARSRGPLPRALSKEQGRLGQISSLMKRMHAIDASVDTQQVSRACKDLAVLPPRPGRSTSGGSALPRHPALLWEPPERSVSSCFLTAAVG